MNKGNISAESLSYDELHQGAKIPETSVTLIWGSEIGRNTIECASWKAIFNANVYIECDVLTTS